MNGFLGCFPAPVLAVEARGYALHHCKVVANFCPKVS